MPNPIHDFQQMAERIANADVFYRRVLALICTECVQILRENSYGETLPTTWQFQITGSGNHLQARVFTFLEGQLTPEGTPWELILSFHDYGTRAHGPVVAQALHWVQNGQDIFAQWVRGIEPKHFSQKVDAAIRKYESTLQERWFTYCTTGRM